MKTIHDLLPALLRRNSKYRQHLKMQQQVKDAVKLMVLNFRDKGFSKSRDFIKQTGVPFSAEELTPDKLPILLNKIFSLCEALDLDIKISKREQISDDMPNIEDLKYGFGYSTNGDFVCAGQFIRRRGLYYSICPALKNSSLYHTQCFVSFDDIMCCKTIEFASSNMLGPRITTEKIKEIGVGYLTSVMGFSKEEAESISANWVV